MRILIDTHVLIWQLLPIEAEHTLLVSRLPYHHKDPFDRMIIAQAIVEEMSLISTDGNFTDYEVELL